MDNSAFACHQPAADTATSQQVVPVAKHTVSFVSFVHYTRRNRSCPCRQTRFHLSMHYEFAILLMHHPHIDGTMVR